MPERSPAPLRPAPRHRTPRNARLGVRVAVGLALTGPAVVAGLAATSVDDAAQETLAAADPGNGAAALLELPDLAARAERVSRSSVRTMRPVTLAPRPVEHLWATAPLNVWTGPGERTERVGLVKEGTKLAVTGQRIDGWAEVLLGDAAKDRWVNATYLSQTKPEPEPSPQSPSGAAPSAAPSGVGGVSSAPCPDGSSIESGITPSADLLYRAVCAAIPSLSTYGGYAPRGEHADGRAIDFMVSSKAEGDALAQFAQANAGALNIRTIIFYQRIWTPERSAEGWRYMEDRGSPTANHMEHVHISVY